MDARVALLMRRLRLLRPRRRAAFCGRLDALRALRGNEVVNAWQEAARAGRIEAVVRDLLVAHYDPIYLQSMRPQLPGIDDAARRHRWDGSDAGLQAAAAEAATAALRKAG